MFFPLSRHSQAVFLTFRGFNIYTSRQKLQIVDWIGLGADADDDLTLKLLRDRSKFKIKFSFPLFSKLLNFWQMFSVAIHLFKENKHKF